MAWATCDQVDSLLRVGKFLPCWGTRGECGGGTAVSGIYDSARGFQAPT